MVNPFRLVRPAPVVAVSHSHGPTHPAHQKPGRGLHAAGHPQGPMNALRPRVPPGRHRQPMHHGGVGDDSGWNPARDTEALSADASLPVEAMARHDGQGGHDNRDPQQDDSDPGSARGGGQRLGRQAGLALWLASRPAAQRDWQQAGAWLATHPTAHDLAQDLLRRLNQGATIHHDLRIAALAGLQEDAPRMTGDLVKLSSVACLLRQVAAASSPAQGPPSPAQVAALLLLPLLLLNWSRPRRTADRHVAAQRLLLAAPSR